MTPESIKQAREIIAAGRIDCFDNISCEELQEFAKAARTGWPQALDAYEATLVTLDEQSVGLAKLGKENDNLRRIIDDELSSGNVYVSMLKEENESLRQERDRLAEENSLLMEKVMRHRTGKDKEDLRQEIRASAAREKVLVEALEFYADTKNWETIAVDSWTTESYDGPAHDCGARARAALERK